MSNNPNKVTVIWQGDSNLSIPYVGLAINGVAMDMDEDLAADFVAQGKASYPDASEAVGHIDDIEPIDEVDGGGE
jgi:hypothetical protein